MLCEISNWYFRFAYSWSLNFLIVSETYLANSHIKILMSVYWFYAMMWDYFYVMFIRVSRHLLDFWVVKMHWISTLGIVSSIKLDLVRNCRRSKVKISNIFHNNRENLEYLLKTDKIDKIDFIFFFGETQKTIILIFKIYN